MKAFPQKYPIDPDEPHHWKHNPLDTGMDLRDYFAVKTLPIAYKIWKDYYFSEENSGGNKPSSFEVDGDYPELIAETAYELADAMMKVRME
jgi:hypothetical protein